MGNQESQKFQAESISASDSKIFSLSGREENGLRESAEQFRYIADAAPVLIWISDTSKKCIWFNKTWLEFTGRTMEQECGNGWAEGVHPDDLPRYPEIYSSPFDARKDFSVEYRLRRHDGGYRWVSVH